MRIETKRSKMSLKIIVTFLAVLVGEIAGHGMMLEPPNRSSLWRFYNNSVINYDDNQNFCGGRAIQWDVLGGKCGVCGDRYDDPHPQNNENTGLYGNGLVVRTYQSGSKIDISILLTVNHLGNFQYSLCVLDDSSQPEAGEDCFKRILLGDGSPQYKVAETDSEVNHTVILPAGLKCDRCVLRWHYTAGNSWGQCEDGTSGDGCGPQETFRSCSDIQIV